TMLPPLVPSHIPRPRISETDMRLLALIVDLVLYVDRHGRCVARGGHRKSATALVVVLLGPTLARLLPLAFRDYIVNGRHSSSPSPSPPPCPASGDSRRSAPERAGSPCRYDSRLT